MKLTVLATKFITMFVICVIFVSALVKNAYSQSLTSKISWSDEIAEQHSPWSIDFWLDETTDSDSKTLDDLQSLDLEEFMANLKESENTIFLDDYFHSLSLDDVYYMLGTSKFLIGDADKRYDTEGNLIERQRDDYQDFNLCNHYYDPFNTSHSPLSKLYCEQITSIKKDLFVEYELEESTSTFSETDTNDTIPPLSFIQLDKLVGYLLPDLLQSHTYSVSYSVQLINYFDFYDRYTVDESKDEFTVVYLCKTLVQELPAKTDTCFNPFLTYEGKSVVLSKEQFLELIGLSKLNMVNSGIFLLRELLRDNEDDQSRDLIFDTFPDYLSKYIFKEIYEAKLNLEKIKYKNVKDTPLFLKRIASMINSVLPETQKIKYVYDYIGYDFVDW